MQNKIYFFDKFFLKRKLSYIVYSSVNYIYHSVHYIPSTEIWKFVPFDHLHSTSPPRSGNHKFDTLFYKLNFLGGSDDKVSVYNVGDLGSIPGLGRFSGEGKDNSLQDSCPENPIDGGAWCPWGRKESDMTERLHFYFSLFLEFHPLFLILLERI